MNLEETVLDLSRRAAELDRRADKRDCALPGNCYFLDEDTVLCYPRGDGDSRYPYAKDGMTLWAYASGYLSLNESTFYILLPADEGKEPYAAFFAGLPADNGEFEPISLLGVARQPRENARRFTVYTPAAVYYITETRDFVFAVRALVDDGKNAVFTLCAVNRGDAEQQIYLSAYFNCLFMYAAGESLETKWFKRCRAVEAGFEWHSTEDLDRKTHIESMGMLYRTVRGKATHAEHTTSRSDFTGGKTNCLNCAEPLRTGRFALGKRLTTFSDTAAAGDIIRFSVPAHGSARVDYAIAACHEEDRLLLLENSPAPDADAWLALATKRDLIKRQSDSALRMTFGAWNDAAIDGEAFNKFVSTVQRQVEFCALAKNSGVSLLGIRDVFQQLEAALVWNPADCREKIIEALSFLDPSGRAPRQYSIPAKGAAPRMDLRAFIDQGVWIIDTVHTYLSYTDDYSLLEEICGYWKFGEGNAVEATDIKDSVLDHLIRIVDYLIKNIDRKYTGCLRALYGDWNDALDGLGVSADPNKDYGSGVSVMASLQFYRNLEEIAEILRTIHYRPELVKLYENTRDELKSALTEHAVARKNDRRRILHGWGDQVSYTVGGFRDPDGQSRDSLTANAFWVISGALGWDASLKNDILSAYDRLDSKYGLKTFDPYFARGTKGVGRIVNLPKGTAENAAVYIHATLFGIRSLFMMGESERAWAQMEKILPLTHPMISTTPFVMSNSYCYNPDLGLDGESMSDWFTGSANVLIKVLLGNAFGIAPDLDGLSVRTAAYMPTDRAEVRVKVKRANVTLRYENRRAGKRRYFVNGAAAATVEDPITGLPYLRIPAALLRDALEIRVED